MTYLERLKRLTSQKIFTDSPDTALTKPPKAPSVSFGSKVKGCNGNISSTPVGADDTPSWGWMLHYADRDSVECYFSPVVTHAELMKLRPDAIGAEPLPDLPAIQERIEVANINSRRPTLEAGLSTDLVA